MISITGKKWEEKKANKNLIEKLRQDYNFSEILSKLIVSRNFDQEEIHLIENNLNFYYENNTIEDNVEEETLRYGIKNFFRNHFYGQSYNLVQFNTEPPKPTYWDDYKT